MIEFRQEIEFSIYSKSIYKSVWIIGICITLLSIVPLKEKQLKIASIALVLIFGSLTFMRASVWKNSIALYSDIIKKHPHSYVALNSLGAEYMLNKNYDMASRYLNATINENPNYYKGYYNRGLLFAQTNRMKNALQDFDKAIALNQYPKAYVARATAYYELKDFPKAMSDAEAVLKTDANNPKANYVLANCYDDLNQLDMLKDGGLLYNDASHLNYMLHNLSEFKQDWTKRVEQYKPEAVMKKFKEVFLDANSF